jgi:Sec-independent protein translocase protein TatA
MMTAIILLLFVGLVVLGPKKTAEMYANAGRAMKKFEHTSSEFRSQLQAEVGSAVPSDPAPAAGTSSPGGELTRL